MQKPNIFVSFHGWALEAEIAHVRKWLGTRQIVAEKCLRTLVDLADGTGSQMFVSTDLEHLVSTVEQDMVVKSGLRKC